MRQVLSDERWQAMRDIFELYGVPCRLLAVSSDVKLNTLRSRAYHENWAVGGGVGEAADSGEGLAERQASGHEAVDAVAAEELAGRMDRPAELAAFLLSQVEGLLKGAKNGRVDKARIDAIWSMIRMVEKAEELSRDTAQDQRKRSDDELAELLTRINNRIDELARHRAGLLVEGKADAG